LKSNLIVILNDNEMSISKNVGAIASYLTQVATSDAYTELRNRVERLVKKIPKVGVPLFEAAKRLKDRTKHMVLSFKVDVIFEELGFKYFGPIDGHNIPLIISTLHHAKEIPGPVLIHVLTKKGKGYPPAEKDPTRYHGIGPFEITSGKPVQKNEKMTYTSVFGKTIVELAKNDSRIVGITAAMIDGTGLEEFAKLYPERFFDVGIAEEHAVTFAGAMAKGGFRPVIAIYSTFLQRAYDEIIHDVCLQNLPVVFAIDRAGIVGEDGATHNGIFDLAYLRVIPNLVVMAPRDEKELQDMLATALSYTGPVAVRYPKGTGPGTELSCKFSLLEIGRAELVRKYQSKVARKVCIIALGSMVYPTLEAAQKLESEGIAAVKVINARFVKPLDRELIVESARKCDLLVTIEEGVLEGGFGSAVLELLEKEKVCVPILRIGLPSAFIEHGKREQILERYQLTAEGIYQQIKNYG
ncbi:MAG: 1-deoxy-D-xylulose-5-phosphate synthase, partial [Candidatus Margulisiibacteriota bacterium]